MGNNVWVYKPDRLTNHSVVCRGSDFLRGNACLISVHPLSFRLTRPLPLGSDRNLRGGSYFLPPRVTTSFASPPVVLYPFSIVPFASIAPGTSADGEAVNVTAEHEGSIQCIALCQGLLHAIAQAVVVVFGLDDGNG